MTTAKRWRKKPSLTGLARVAEPGPRGSELRLGEVELARTIYTNGKLTGNPAGWYWVALENPEFNITRKNTCWELVDTEEEAKQQAKAYIDNSFKAAKNQ